MKKVKRYRVKRKSVDFRDRDKILYYVTLMMTGFAFMMFLAITHS